MLKNKELGKITIQDLITAQKALIFRLRERGDADPESNNALDILTGMNSIYNRMTDKTLSG